MRVLHLVDSPKTGGKERQLVELLSGLETSNIENQVVIFNSGVDLVKINESNIKLSILDRKRRGWIASYRLLLNIIYTFKPDIIHTWESLGCFLTIPIKYSFGVILINGSIRNATPLKIFSLNWMINRFNFVFSDYILSNSHSGLKSYRVPFRKSFVIRNGVDFRRLDCLEDKNAIRNKYGIRNQYIIGMVGNFTPKKDWESFIIAAEILLQQRADISFIAVGGGRKLKSTMKMIKPDFKENFIFTNTISDVESVLNIFTISILLTNTKNHHEGTPNALLESMALEKPVIATNSGGNKELIKEGMSGYLVNDNSPEILADKCLHLLNNRELRMGFGKNGRACVKKYFNINKMVSEFNKFYGEIII